MSEPVDLGAVFHVGDHWGEPALGDLEVRVHRVDPAGGRVQIRVVTNPGAGKEWAFHRSLKRGTQVLLRKARPRKPFTSDTEPDPQPPVVEPDPPAFTCTVLSSMGKQVTLGNFALSPWLPATPAVQANEEIEQQETEP